MLKDAGAKEVHMRIACPEIKFSCLYGIDTPDPQELISNSKGDIEKIKEYLGLDSLAFLTLDGLYNTVKGDSYKYSAENDNDKSETSGSGFCDACFTGKYFI
jgi:amidophosphoribosyltransferase